MKKTYLTSAIATVLFLTSLITMPSFTHAALGLSDAEGVATSEGLYKGDANELIQAVILWILSISAVLALAALIWSGFLYITAFTNEKNVEKAKSVALYAIMGLIFMSAAFLIIRILGKTLT